MQKGRRRALGQHFLKDAALSRAIVERFIDEAKASECREVLEIGPGRGALTDILIDECAARDLPLTLAEKDDALAKDWQSRGQKVLARDFLEVPESEWLPRERLGVISNLPYSSGTAILQVLAAHPGRIGAMVLMFQKEVGQRLRAAPADSHRGSLSVWVQNAWDVSLFRNVSRGAFNPPPDVESEVVVLRPLPEPRIAAPEDPLWNSLLKVAFKHRRKMLRSGLASSGAQWTEALARSGVEPTLRAEVLDWHQWLPLYRAARDVLGPTHSVK